MKTLKVMFMISWLILLLSTAIQAQTTQFSYQGSLKDGGNPANGNYDFEFVLFGALSGGTQLGPTNALNNVAVTNGNFSVYLDFGNQFSAGDNRWLEIRTRLAGQPGFTILAPRQPLTTVPYAWKSQEASIATNATTATNALQLGGVAANQYVVTTDPRLSDARDPLPNSSAYIQNQNENPQPATFNIAGLGRALFFDAGSYYINSDPVLRTPAGGNVFVGRTAGSGNTSGAANSFFGNSAGAGNLTGSSNSFFGYDAGRVNTSGSSNAFFGERAGFSNNGSFNSFFGDRAGESNTSASYNSFFGDRAGIWNTTGTFNAFFGATTGRSNTTGNYNSFFGTEAGFSNTTGNSNAFFGFEAGFSNTTGIDNAFFGSNSGQANTTAIDNAFFGARAGQMNTTGVGNAFFGTKAGHANTTGGSNAFFGRQAGEANTSASNNAFFGNFAGKTNNTGYNNSFFGHEAGELNTTGRDNAFFGSYAGQQNLDGANNAFFGEAAGQTNTTGGQNTFLGSFAGQDNTTGSYNTMIGHAADVAFNNLENATAIGYQASVSTSNSMVLGSISGVNGSTSNTNVGIGTQAPIARFQVRGPVLFSNGDVLADPNRAHLNVVSTSGTANLYLQGAGSTKGINFGVSGSSPNATLYISQYDGTTYQDRVVVNQDGNIGIGNAAPSANAKLQVSGSVRVTNGSIFVAQPNTLIITSPNGACWGLTVNNSGVLSTFSTTCP